MNAPVKRLPAPSSHWSRLSERGSLLGLRLVCGCYRWCGYYLAHALLIPVTFYFFCTGAAARRASLEYLRRINPCLPAHAQFQSIGWRESFRHMLNFSGAALDRLAAWAGHLVRPVDFPNQALLEQQLASGRGAVLISAHLGNLDMTRAIAHLRGVRGINAVVFTEHAQRYSTMMAAMNPDFPLNLIAVSSMGADTAMLLKERIDRGELVVIVADRTPPAQNGRAVKVSFLGMPASFPIGPFVLASLMECPAYLFFCLREGARYQIYLESFAEQIMLQRQQRLEQLTALAQRYAQRLEYYCCKAPLQWFNFFDFWRTEQQDEEHD